MAVGASNRPKTYTKYTLKDLDPLIHNGNDIPTFILEKVTLKFLNHCDELRNFIKQFFSDQKDMDFVADLYSNEKNNESVITKWKQDFAALYNSNCPEKIKVLLSNLVELDEFQCAILLNITSSNILFCFIVFDSLGIESFIDNLVGKKLILKYGSLKQINKYVLNKSHQYHIMFGTNEKTYEHSNLLNIRCSVKTSKKTNNVTLKGHKWFVPSYKNLPHTKKCYIFFLINEDIKALNNGEKITLKEQFSLMLLDSDADFESKIQRLQVYNDSFVSYNELKFNSIDLPYTIKELLLGGDGNGLAVIHYKIHITQVFYGIAITSNTQNTVNYIMDRANCDLEVMIQPPKVTKIIKTDHFKENLSKNYAELKVLIAYCFTMLFDLKQIGNENTDLNFAIGKLMIPQKCESIIAWALALMENQIFLKENQKLLYIKSVFYRFQATEQSNNYLAHYIGKARVSWYLRIQRGLRSIKNAESDKEKENIVTKERDIDLDTKLYWRSNTNSAPLLQAARYKGFPKKPKSALSGHQSCNDVLRPYTSGERNLFNVHSK